MTVRLATGLDAEAVAAIWNHYIRETSVTFNAQEKNAEEVAGLISTRPAFFVALDQGRGGRAEVAQADQAAPGLVEGGDLGQFGQGLGFAAGLG